MTEELETVLAGLRDEVRRAVGIVEDARLRSRGLVGYEGLRERLAIDGKLPCMRTVKKLAKKYAGVLPPVPVGHRLVGFRLSRVEAFLAAMESKRGGSAARGAGALNL